MSTIKKLMMTAAGGEALAIEDVFSTYLYTGNGSTQTITNGVDLAGEGGLVWLKGRTDPGDGAGVPNHILFDTARGNNFFLRTSSTAAQGSGFSSLFSFLSSGFSVGNNHSINYGVNNTQYASWTFRKAPRFFDVVTWTGTGTPQNISHNLGVTPGCIMIKSTSISGNWWVWHRTLPDARYGLYLNGTSAQTSSNTTLDWTDPTDTVFRVGTSALTNSSGATYVAYLFAHDPLGPSGDGSDGLIACGSYTGNGSTDGPEIDLGWEPQWVLIKRTNFSENWVIVDNMRGIVSGGDDRFLHPNLGDAEGSDGGMNLTATGFKIADRSAIMNEASAPYIYIAIRRGPMRQPESGTEVFAVTTGNATSAPFFNSNWPVDFGLKRNTSADNWYVTSRMQGSYWLRFNDTNNENLDANIRYDYQNGWWAGYAGSAIHSWMFRRAPGFFDVVAYKGTGSASANTLYHNLGVTPELMVTKARNTTSNWETFYVPDQLTANKYLALNTTNAYSTYDFLDSADETSVVLRAQNSNPNNSGNNYIAYLFASLPGVSKVGSYTGNGTSQTINCGFTTGARFVLLKRTNAAQNWAIFDSERGIVSGNDPFLYLNTTDAEVSSDIIDPNSSGFTVNATINGLGDNYIYLAIA